MPTVTEPKLQPPMEAANPALKQDQAGIVTKQPVSTTFGGTRYR